MRPKTHKGKRYALAHNRYQLVEIVGDRDVKDYEFSGVVIWPYIDNRVTDCWLGDCFRMIKREEFAAENIDFSACR